MKSILNSCEPRSDIIAGTFNPEIFTASLSEVCRFYSGHGTGINAIYTDAKQFFREGTYATDGMRMVVSEVFSRLAGDNTAPAIHRLETAFGGGKTHTLIACAHLAHKGKEAASFAGDMVDVSRLPNPGDITVAAIAGDELPVQQPKGTRLVPYTLWGEIAYQIGGQDLYQMVENEAASRAAPGKSYFEAVFGGRKVLLMIDELAQYAARLSAAMPDGGNQLAAFLMSLHGYARTHSGMAILLTLASAADAFANQTALLATLLSDVTGKEISRDEALGIGQQALKGVGSVVARDATAVVPVQAAEISRVLAKRLFDRIDPSAAGDTARAYEALYRKNASLLPDDATRAEFVDRMTAHYPFHPTLVDFLNNKLAASEDFQGTRGVLRVLALTVRNIWKKRAEVPMIHACHIDLRDARTVNEMVARTGGGDLLPVLNADVGGVDTERIEGGRSNAELADRRNPHPEGWPMHEYAWKTIFLHSLVGREQGLESNIFGLTEQEALFQVAFPGLTPPQIAEALKETKNSAFYLRLQQGRYYASLDPSVNIALAKIRRSLTNEEIEDLLDVKARKVVSSSVKTFHVVHDVTLPEHIPDNKGMPVLALIALGTGEVNVEDLVTTAGPNRPRMEQNLVLVLVPETVASRAEAANQASLFGGTSSPAEDARKRLLDLGRTVLAMNRLKTSPQNYGINPKKLEDEGFRQRFSERDKALETTVTEAYRRLWYPASDGRIAFNEIRTAGGEGGVSVLEQIRKTLLNEGELVTADHCTLSGLTNLKELFFKRGDTIPVQKLRENFARLRTWPILEEPALLEQIVREGVRKGIWCLFRMGSDESTTTLEFYDREKGELPFELDLTRDYSIVTSDGARKRGWATDKGPDLTKVELYVNQVAGAQQIVKVKHIAESIKNQWGEVPAKTLNQAIARLVQAERLMTYRGTVDQEKKPDLITGTKASFYTAALDDVIVTPKKAAEKGWVAAPKQGFRLEGRKGAEILFPMLRKIGSFYERGASTAIDSLDLVELKLPHGGTLRISVMDAPPRSMKDLAELFETVGGLATMGDNTEAYLTVKEKGNDCPFMAELEKDKERKDQGRS